MDQKAFHMTLLFDFYGDLLTDRQKEFYDLYHNEDLSLAEIAENAGITRQGVRDVLVPGGEHAGGAGGKDRHRPSVFGGAFRSEHH